MNVVGAPTDTGMQWCWPVKALGSVQVIRPVHTHLHESCLHMHILWYVRITRVTLIRNNTSHVLDSTGKIHCMFQERGANYLSTRSRGTQFPNKNTTSYSGTLTQLTTKEVLIFPLHHTHSGSKGQLAVCCLSSCPVLSINKSEMLSHSLCGIYIYKPYGCRPTPLAQILWASLK